MLKKKLRAYLFTTVLMVLIFSCKVSAAAPRLEVDTSSAEYKNNTITAYGSVIAGYTNHDDRIYLRTLEPEDVGSVNAVLRGQVQGSGKSRDDIMGFVYSTNHNSLDVKTGKAVYVNDDSSGIFELKVDKLSPNTTYYYRTFIRNASRNYEYGNRISFKTLSGYELEVEYYTSDGSVVGRETFRFAEGYTLTEDDLTVPAHYILTDQSWSYTVKREGTIEVAVGGQEKAFINGDSDNTFRPDQAIIRADVARVLYTLYGENKSYSHSPFKDVSLMESYSTAIAFVEDKGYMEGYSEGTFRPHISITRAEMAVVMTKVYGLDTKNIPIGFYDVNGHWGRDYISAVAEEGFLNGYEDGSFRPEATITRAEATAMFAKAEGRSTRPLSNKTYSDVPESHWAYEIIMNASIPM